MTLRFRSVTLALALGAAGASTGCAAALVKADLALTRTIGVTQDTDNALCDAGIKSAEDCKKFNVRLIPTISGAKAFNLAAQEGSYTEVPAMLDSVLGLRDAAVEFFNDPILLKSIQGRIEALWALLNELRGK